MFGGKFGTEYDSKSDKPGSFPWRERVLFLFMIDSQNYDRK